jgi:uncharacterized protein YaiI (UPF0178 family)
MRINVPRNKFSRSLFPENFRLTQFWAKTNFPPCLRRIGDANVYIAWPLHATSLEGSYVAGASIWVDADACPNVIKDILFRAAERTGVAVTLVANQPLQIPRIASLRAVQVSSGFDVADGEIVRRIAAGDLVITADIPLAAEVIAKGGEALNPRGERYSPDTIRGVLAMRDFMDTMRSSGNVGGGPPPLTQANRNAFAGHLDTWLARRTSA